jgi:hypothetical protein
LTTKPGDIAYPAGKNVAVVEGHVIPIGSKQLTPSEIVAQIKDAVALPYSGRDADKIGMTLLEAAIFEAAKKAADGDLDALEKLLNRLMGKPIQAVVSAQGSLREFLDGIARSESEAPRDPDPLDD